MEIKRIKFERTGGFAGIRMAADLKPDDMPDEQVRSISELIDDLDFNELPERMTGDSNMPDQFTYTITVETDKWKRTVITGDTSGPEKLQELLQVLNRLARAQKRQ